MMKQNLALYCIYLALCLQCSCGYILSTALTTAQRYIDPFPESVHTTMGLENRASRPLSRTFSR